MIIKINNKLISIPPFLSTKWSYIASIHSFENYLIFNLLNDEIIEIPNLPEDIIHKIFEKHATYLESEEADLNSMPLNDQQENPTEASSFPFNLPPELQALSGQLPFHIGMENGVGGFQSLMQHNSEQKDAKDLPKEILEKIATISGIVAPNQEMEISKPEPHCNCFHCQISRAILKKKEKEEDEKEVEEDLNAEVSDDELNFQQWDIKQDEEHLFTVTNRLDSKEEFHVHLKDPIGCTCGKDNCEHIIAVLES